MKEMWSGFLEGAGALGDRDIQAINDSCLGQATETHLMKFASTFSSFGASTKIFELLDAFAILKELYNEVISECHFSELESHFTFHSRKHNIMGFLTHFAEEAENIGNIWESTVIHGGLRKYKEFGVGLGQIVGLLLDGFGAPHQHNRISSI